MNLISWPTFLHRYNPHRSESHDGVLPIRYTIAPTLDAAGFGFIGDFTEYELPKSPKDIAKDIVRDWREYQVMPPDEDKMLFVYYVHRGSHISSMPDTVNVYGGLPPQRAPLPPPDPPTIRPPDQTTKRSNDPTTQR